MFTLIREATNRELRTRHATIESADLAYEEAFAQADDPWDNIYLIVECDACYQYEAGFLLTRPKVSCPDCDGIQAPQ
jgi:hypothetical protein